MIDPTFYIFKMKPRVIWHSTFSRWNHYRLPPNLGAEFGSFPQRVWPSLSIWRGGFCSDFLNFDRKNSKSIPTSFKIFIPTINIPTQSLSIWRGQFRFSTILIVIHIILNMKGLVPFRFSTIFIVIHNTTSSRKPYY